MASGDETSLSCEVHFDISQKRNLKTPGPSRMAAGRNPGQQRRTWKLGHTMRFSIKKEQGD
jgi:hypothetical protein